jgi:hypothetical protein
MVGKPNFPEGTEKRTDLRGASNPTRGLDALDQEREASMADEGGASGALMENLDDLDPILMEAMQQKSYINRSQAWSIAAGVGTVLCVGAALYYFSRRSTDAA